MSRRPCQWPLSRLLIFVLMLDAHENPSTEKPPLHFSVGRFWNAPVLKMLRVGPKWIKFLEFFETR